MYYVSYIYLLIYVSQTIPENIKVCCPKVMCTISTKPFYRAMQSFLHQLYTLPLSGPSASGSMELIESVVARVPLPLPGGRAIRCLQDMPPLQSAPSSAWSPIDLSLPSPYSYPFLDLDLSAPLRCLSVANMLVVFTLLLREPKMIFICQSSSMLSEVMETFRCLLFPLLWSATYVSRLPHSLTGLFESLGGFVVGYNVLENVNSDVKHEWKPTNDGLDGVENAWIADLAPSTYVVDLTGNRILQASNDQTLLPLTASERSQILALLPVHGCRRMGRLGQICKQHSIGPEKSELTSLALNGRDLRIPQDKASSSSSKAIKSLDFPTEEVRDLFLLLMVDVLGEYTPHIILPSRDTTSTDTYRTFDEGFQVESYLASFDTPRRALASAIVQTQMFSYFIQRRVEGSDPGICFFERAAAYLKENKIAGLTVVSDAPRPLLAPLHDCLEVDMQLKANSAIVTMEREHQTYIKSHTAGNGNSVTDAFTCDTFHTQVKSGYMRPLVPIKLSSKDSDFLATYSTLKKQRDDTYVLDRTSPRTVLAAGLDKSTPLVVSLYSLSRYSLLCLNLL